MAYASRQDMEDLWGVDFVSQLLAADVDGDVAIARALERASADIDLHLSARYTTPIAGNPLGLVTPAVNIAVYNLAIKHAVLTKTIEDRFKAAIAMLERIADGKAGLGENEPSVSSDGDGDSSSGGAYFEANERRFSRRTLP